MILIAVGRAHGLHEIGKGVLGDLAIVRSRRFLRQNRIESLYGTLPLFFSFLSLFRIKRPAIVLIISRRDEIYIPAYKTLFCDESCILGVDHTKLHIELVAVQSFADGIKEGIELSDRDLVGARGIDVIVGLGGLA